MAIETTEEKGGESEEGADKDLDLKDDDKSGEEDKGGEGKEDKAERKPETPEAKRARLTRELDQHNKKHPPTDEPKPKPGDKKGEFDYGQKAFLVASGIKAGPEMELVQQYVKDSGKPIESVLTNKAFMADLKDIRDGEAAGDAIPDKSDRSGNQSKTSVEYWVAKGELPPNTPENQELRRKVVAAKTAKAKGGSPFSKTPVIGG